MSLYEDAQWERVDSPTAAESLVSNGEVEGRSEQGKTRLQFVAEPGHQNSRSCSSTASEEPIINRRLATSFKVVQQRRDRLVGRRVNILNQQIENSYHRSAIIASTTRIENAAEALLLRYRASPSMSSEYLELQQAVQESMELSKTIKDMEAKLQQATKLLNRKETELYERESKVYGKLAQITKISSPLPSPWQRPPQPPRSTSSASSTKTDPRARRYYDRAGDAKILRERIHNMQVQHRHELLQRENGHIGKVPERLFRERFDKRLSSVLEELERAKKDAFLMKLACQRRNIALEDDEESQHNQEMIDAQLDDDHRVLSTFAGHQSQAKSLVMADIISGYMDSTTKIRRWLKTMPQNTGTMVSGLIDDNKHDLDMSEGITGDVSSDLIAKSSEEDAPVAVETRVTADFLAHESRRAFSFQSFVSQASGAAHTFSDGDLSQADSTGDARGRRYSDPNLDRPSWLQAELLPIAPGLSKAEPSHRLRRNSH
jgi:hypothetical protein